MEKPGWGVKLSSDLMTVKVQEGRVVRLTKELSLEVDNLAEKIALLNQKRILRVGELLDKRKQRICLLHSQIFTSLPFEESLRPSDDVVSVLMITSWTTTYRIDDFDVEESHHSSSYHTTACSLCGNVISKGSFTTNEHVENTMRRNQPEISALPICEKLYPLEVLNKASVLFGMQPVTKENVENILYGRA